MRFSIPAFIGLLALLLQVGCGGGSTVTDGGSTDGGAPIPVTHMTHDFPALDVASGGDVFGQCQSWTLNNDQPLFVNSVGMTAGTGWHHSNWVYVPDTMYDGPDGTFHCTDRGFNEVTAATEGGVFFAQSTQATHEAQQFQPGVVIAIPPHSRIIGSIHLVNVTSSAVHTNISFDVGTIPEASVAVRLSALSLDFQDGLIVPANMPSDSTLTCDMATVYAANLRMPPNFKIYYILPHYHQLGTGMTVEALGPDGGVTTIFNNSAGIGDPLGKMLDTPFDMTGSTKLRMTCHYDNGTSRDFRFANSLSGEMCVVLVYTDSPLTIGGLSNNGGVDATSTLVGGVPDYTASCGVIGIRAPTF